MPRCNSRGQGVLNVLLAVVVLALAVHGAFWVGQKVGMVDPPEVSCDQFSAAEITAAEQFLVYSGPAPDDRFFDANLTEGWLAIYPNGSIEHSGPAPIETETELRQYDSRFYVLSNEQAYVTVSLYEHEIRVGPPEEGASEETGSTHFVRDPRTDYDIDRCSVEVRDGGA